MAVYTAWGFDYAFRTGISVAFLKAQGADFVCRYISGFSKDITLAELASYEAAGIDVVINYETTGSQLGFAAGVSSAHAAQGFLNRLGIANAPVIFSPWDHDPLGNVAGIMDFIRGAVSVMGHNRVGLYAGHDAIVRCLDLNLCKYTWETYAWQHGAGFDPRSKLQQYENAVHIGGANVDRDRATVLDYGQVGIASVGVPTLRQGDTGDAVKALQTVLNLIMNSGLVVDGDFGPATFVAVKAFQTKYKLTVDGIVGPVTQAKLKDVASSIVTPPTPPKEKVPTKIVSAGNLSLAATAKRNGMSAVEVIWLTAQHQANPGPAQTSYITKGNWADVMPEGMIYYVMK
jgi:Rv2525c-like, glycoside hydrolase-like domain/Putative peptidoglycan binding domain